LRNNGEELLSVVATATAHPELSLEAEESGGAWILRIASGFTWR